MKIMIHTALILLITAAFAMGGPKTTANTDVPELYPVDECIPGPFQLVSLNAPRASDQVMVKFIAPAGQGRGSGNWLGVFKAGKPAKKEYIVTWLYLTSTDCTERFYLPAGQFEAYILTKDSLRADEYAKLSEAVTINVRPKE